MGSPMQRAAGGVVERIGRLPWPAQVILGALTLVGAITMVQRILAIFAWLVTLLVILVILAALAFWAVTGGRRD